MPLDGSTAQWSVVNSNRLQTDIIDHVCWYKIDWKIEMIAQTMKYNI